MWSRTPVDLLVCLLCIAGIKAAQTNYLIGVGMGDITGPAAEVNMMGYANPSQTSHGIHIRQYSRAFIVANPANSTRVVFVNVDACMISQLTKMMVVEKLQKMYGSLYTESNVCLSGIHTHSGPGGFHQYVLFDITSLGFIRESLDALVEGIVQSIVNAHNSVRPGNIFINEGELLDSNINRSPSAYLNNPEHERARYKYDVDKNMTIIKFVDASAKPIGMISWFAVHCTSMNNTNKLISGDNKGYASQLFERAMAASGQARSNFVAAFAQSNEGDVSPNTKGPHCTDTGKPCDILHSTCNGKNEYCVSPGPGKDMFESTKIIGTNQFQKAMDLFKSATKMLTGPVDFRHQFVNMTNQTIQVNESYTATTCKPAMGYSFAAGTTDGPGMFDFKQGTTKGNLLWDLIRDLIHPPTKQQIKCHFPKPILLDTGEITEPYPWQPSVVDTQLFRIGELAIVAVPGEFSTMSGRRVRDAVTETLLTHGLPANVTSVIAGLSNTYSDYITTFEEYQIQRYEGASTIFGPYTLTAYIQQFKRLAQAIATGTQVPKGPHPPNLIDEQLSFLPPVIFDAAPMGKNFGDVQKQPSPKYQQGSTVQVAFVSANPRNNLMTGKTFLTVELVAGDGKTQVVYTDKDWETKFEWQRTSTILGESIALISWDIPDNQQTGTYKISHFGFSKSFLGSTSPFSGTTQSFQVVKKIDETKEDKWRELNQTKDRKKEERMRLKEKWVQLVRNRAPKQPEVVLI